MRISAKTYQCRNVERKKDFKKIMQSLIRRKLGTHIDIKGHFKENSIIGNKKNHFKVKGGSIHQKEMT